MSEESTAHGWRRIARPLLAFAALFLALASGCGTPAVSIETRKDHVVPSAPSKRLFVISQVARADAAWAEAFADSMKSMLDRVGVKNEVQTRSPLSVQSDRSAYADAMMQFKPDIWLVVEPGDATVDREGRSLSRRFEAGLFKYGQVKGERILVWRASILVKPGGAYVRASDMDELAWNLIRKLRTDGFICPPARPQSAGGAPDSGYPVDGNLKQE